MRLLSACVLILVSSLIAAAQTVIPGGYISGTWVEAGSPYQIQGDITVHADSVLTIEPGVEIIFGEHYKLTVNGTLLALGTEVDSITFRAAVVSSGWNGIRFVDANETSQLSYCVLRDGRALWIAPNNLGGAIYCSNSSPTIADCDISGNYCAGGGGGIYCVGSSMPTISRCRIYNNTAVLDGGGIHCWDGAAPVIDHCAIFGNAGNYGGGIFIGNTTGVTISNSTVSRNYANQQGGGINSYQAGSSITNTIVEGNSGNGGVNLYDSPNTTLTYNDVFNNDGGDLTGNSLPPGAGELVMVNANDDSCDVYYNIFLDPLFANPEAGDFQITWASFPVIDETRSPSIDAGDPASLFDPDSTITDIGRYFFDHRRPDIELSVTALDFDTVMIGEQADLPLTIYNLGEADLVINDIYSSLTVFGANWNTADSLILPGDSLEIIVSFAPAEMVAYEDTLVIANSDELVTVLLQGQGIGTGYPEFEIDLAYVSGSPVSPEGGLLYFDVYLSNNSGEPQDFDAWLDVEYEGGAPTSVVLRSFTNYQPGWAVNRPNTWFPVPGGYAAGNYELYGRCGTNPDEIWTEDGFPFEKSGIADGLVFVPFVPEGVPDIFGEVEESVNSLTPREFALHGACPNPFNPATVISYSLPANGLVNLTVYDVHGRQVTELVDGWRQEGMHDMTFDASGFASGIYFYRLTAGEYIGVGKMVLMK